MSQQKSGFGFGEANSAIRDLASNVKPRHRPADAAPRELSDAADSVARQVGFESRERSPAVVKRPARARATGEPMQQLSMRVPVSVVAKFARFAEDEGLSYPKALAELLDREIRRGGVREKE